MLKEILFLLMIFMLFIPSTKALGTLQKKNYLEIIPGKTAEFIVLFWNSEDLPITVNLSIITKPDNWLVIVEPKDFILEKNITSSEVVSSGNEYINALPVKVLIMPDENVKPGIYDVMLKMTAGREEKGISFFQEKSFNFRVNVTGIEQGRFEDRMFQKSENKTGSFFVPIQRIENIAGSKWKIAFYSLILLLSLVVAWMVYRL
jgi:hypothetical protein